MEEQLPYYEDRQQESWEDYHNLEQQREDLHRQCLEQSLTISEANERIKVLEDALRPMLEVCKDPKSYDLVRVSEIISKALEVK